MLYQELEQRGLLFQQTSEELKTQLEKPMTFYCGIDPTADSLHVGSLLPIITMKRLQQHGHKPLLLVGGATGMIGDPSGKSKERVLLDRDTIEKNVAGMLKNAEKILDFTGPQAAEMVNNMDWMGPYSYIDFLRDVGKHFSVNIMLGKDSVKSRIEDREQGISYTEFSYMLLQAYDFYHLYKERQCQLQIGGSDQWGNITAGVDLIRRMQGDRQVKDSCFGLTFPLVTKSDGSKFGKTEQGNVWLSPERTSPYQFYQFFLRLSDDDVVKLMYYFSLKPVTELKELEERFKAEPHKREAQAALAEELTLMIHGQEALEKAKAASQALFAKDLMALDLDVLQDAFGEAPAETLSQEDKKQMTLVDLLVRSKLCSSKGAARKDIKAGAIYINNNRFEGEDLPGDAFPLLHGRLMILRRGKKNYFVARFD
jgi:tyrosyl-tRNA synthetase